MKAYKRFKVWLYQLLETKFLSRFVGNCYSSIDDLPIFYWNKIQQESNLSYLIRTDSVHIEKKKVSAVKMYALNKIWENIMTEYVERFGFSEQFIEIARKKKEILGHMVDMIVDGDKSRQAFIDMCNLELTEMTKDSESAGFDEMKACVVKGMGVTIDPMRTTVSEFYSYVKLLEKQNKAANT